MPTGGRKTAARVGYPQFERLPGQTWQKAKDARRYRPLTDDVVHDHLSGKGTVGLYPMLTDDTCRLLACDFDASQWQLDAQAYARAAIENGRNCLVLTRQTAHVEVLAERLRRLGHEPHLLYATRKTKELKEVLAFLADPPADGPPLLVVATDKYVGEGYDCPRLDTLFLAHPVSFKGSMVQYVGRILRSRPGKTTVDVHDYVDGQVGVLAAMWRKRSRSYGQLGFTVADDNDGLTVKMEKR